MLPFRRAHRAFEREPVECRCCRSVFDAEAPVYFADCGAVRRDVRCLEIISSHTRTTSTTRIPNQKRCDCCGDLGLSFVSLVKDLMKGKEQLDSNKKSNRKLHRK